MKLQPQPVAPGVVILSFQLWIGGLLLSVFPLNRFSTRRLCEKGRLMYYLSFPPKSQDVTTICAVRAPRRCFFLRVLDRMETAQPDPRARGS